MANPSIGGVSLENVISWDEVGGQVSIPIKKVIRKETPTIQAQYFTRSPREIIIKTRATAAIKESLVALKNAHLWYTLLDYDGATKVDDVWITEAPASWKGEEDESNPWLVTLSLVCSST